MESKIPLVVVLVNVVLVKSDLLWDARNSAFDPNLYEEVLDPVQCQAQLAYIAENNTMLRMAFADAGIRIPRGILMGNTLDLGNYHQCLGISEQLEDMHIEGKYCKINLRVNPDSNFNGAEVPNWAQFDPNMLQIGDDLVNDLEKYDALSRSIRAVDGIPREDFRTDVSTGMGEMSFNLAICIPKPCTTDEGISGLIFNFTRLGLQYEERSCRLNNDKPWVPVDYIAIILFSIIGLITLLSTCYDLCHTFILKKDPKEASTIGKSFSMYTNAKRLTTFKSTPEALECVDGIRSLAMMWVVVGHTFATVPAMMNMLDVLHWVQSFRALWLISAPITVDTFFMLSGMLVVYSTAGKLTDMKLLKNLHLFYLNRFLRMFPLLATTILLQASIVHRIADGPQWENVASNTDNCRTFWWSTLLYVQNYVSPNRVCLGHTWYLAVDMQLHLLSPIVLFWVLSGKRKIAWSALTAGLLVSIVAATIYVFIKQFPGFILSIPRVQELSTYMKYYYVNTLTRASPFFVGMVFGYILHTWRGRRVIISKLQVAILWLAAVFLIGTTTYVVHPMMAFDYDNQILDSFVNSFQRPAWAMAIGWIIFACVHGYGGPVNWLLSLQVWKLPSRISYGMYLLHFPMQYMIGGMALAPVYFTPAYTIYHFLAQFVMAFVLAFIFTLIIDSPFSTLFKLLLGDGSKKPRPEVATNNTSDGEDITTAKGYINHDFVDTETDNVRQRQINTNI